MFGIVFLLFILACIYCFYKHKYNYWKSRNVPYAEPSFIFGNIGNALMLRRTLSKICIDIYNEFNDSVYVGMFNCWSPAILLRDPDLIKEVLIKEFSNFHDNLVNIKEETDPITAKNPFVLRGEEWKKVRTQLTSQFTAAKLKLIIPLMENISKSLVKYIHEQIEKNQENCLEIKDLAKRYTGQSVLSCGYGIDGRSFSEEIPIAFKFTEEVTMSTVIVQLKQTLSIFSTNLGRLLNSTFLGSPVSKSFWDMILSTVKYRQENNIKLNDYLDYIHNLKISSTNDGMTDVDLVSYAYTLFLDGFETSALTISFILYELALNPEIQSRARNEIQRTLKKSDKTLTHESLQELQYIQSIIFETLRKHPIILIQTRICTNSYKLSPPKDSSIQKSVLIEKGTTIYIPLYSIHNDPKYYPNPDVFDPDRFMEQNRRSQPKGCFLGFGDGPRICLGRKFAIQQIEIMLIFVLQEFEIQMNAKTSVPYERDFSQILNLPKNGIFLNFCKLRK